ncbi:venom acid phosphatase Acph-1-like [Diachasmimorpha longicaudata]|uniref:venom acid phosphatase Acph-1-like n=1 Tax=Diachasmimorpha longicaudata TaxID=58733 RepID=UPI0030B8941C
MKSIIFCRWIIFFLGILEVTSDLEYKFVNVIFRHGDRTPMNQPYESFRTSPYAKSDFSPYGHGQLTNKGKQRVYELGKYMRTRFGQFLGDIDDPNAVSARSTHTDRTHMSLQVAMAGMFPPGRHQKWNSELNWQPVVMNVPSPDDDFLLFHRHPEFEQQRACILKYPQLRAEIETLSDFAKNLSDWIGAPVTDTKQYNFIYHGLESLESMEYSLPSWATGIYPRGLLLDAVYQEYQVLNYNWKMRCLSGGTLLKKFTDNMLNAASGNGQSKLKIELLAADDINIVSLLRILNLYEPHIPKYTSAIFVELLGDGDKYFINIHYYLGSPSATESLRIPGCGELCPLEEFVKLFRRSMPTAETICWPRWYSLKNVFYY